MAVVAAEFFMGAVDLEVGALVMIEQRYVP